MLKTIIGELERIKIMIWTMMWLNESIATINAMFQLLDIYRFVAKICFLGYYIFVEGKDLGAIFYQINNY